MEFLETLKETRKTYAEMVKFCTNDLILNNVIVDELERNGFYFDDYCGSRFYYTDENGDEIDEYKDGCEEEYEDIFQTYIISGDAAERFAEYTDEIVGYCEALDLYVLYVTHYGTSRDYVKSNWKQEE